MVKIPAKLRNARGVGRLFEGVSEEQAPAPAPEKVEAPAPEPEVEEIVEQLNDSAEEETTEEETSEMPDYASMKHGDLRKLVPNEVEAQLPDKKKATLVAWLEADWNKNNG